MKKKNIMTFKKYSGGTKEVEHNNDVTTHRQASRGTLNGSDPYIGEEYKKELKKKEDNYKVTADKIAAKDKRNVEEAEKYNSIHNPPGPTSYIPSEKELERRRQKRLQREKNPGDEGYDANVDPIVLAQKREDAKKNKSKRTVATSNDKAPLTISDKRTKSSIPRNSEVGTSSKTSGIKTVDADSLKFKPGVNNPDQDNYELSKLGKDDSIQQMNTRKSELPNNSYKPNIPDKLQEMKNNKVESENSTEDSSPKKMNLFSRVLKKPLAAEKAGLDYTKETAEKEPIGPAPDKSGWVSTPSKDAAAPTKSSNIGVSGHPNETSFVGPRDPKLEEEDAKRQYDKIKSEQGDRDKRVAEYESKYGPKKEEVKEAASDGRPEGHVGKWNDPEEMARVAAWQRKRGLKDDGVWGKDTQAAWQKEQDARKAKKMNISSNKGTGTGKDADKPITPVTPTAPNNTGKGISYKEYQIKDSGHIEKRASNGDVYFQNGRVRRANGKMENARPDELQDATRKYHEDFKETKHLNAAQKWAQPKIRAGINKAADFVAGPRDKNGTRKRADGYLDDVIDTGIRGLAGTAGYLVGAGTTKSLAGAAASAATADIAAKKLSSAATNFLGYEKEDGNTTPGEWATNAALAGAAGAAGKYAKPLATKLGKGVVKTASKLPGASRVSNTASKIVSKLTGKGASNTAANTGSKVSVPKTGGSVLQKRSNATINSNLKPVGKGTSTIASKSAASGSTKASVATPTPPKVTTPTTSTTGGAKNVGNQSGGKSFTSKPSHSTPADKVPNDMVAPRQAGTVTKTTKPINSVKQHNTLEDYKAYESALKNGNKLSASTKKSESVKNIVEKAKTNQRSTRVKKNRGGKKN
jgi:hypothetical protein